MLKKDYVDMFKYIGVIRYTAYKERFDKMNITQLIETKASYEAKVKAKGDKGIINILSAVAIFIICGLMTFVGKIIYLNAKANIDNMEVLLDIATNLVRMGVLVFLVVISMLAIYKHMIKKSYIELKYINQYLLENNIYNLL